MLKLVRNQLEAQAVLISIDDKKVKWDHIIQLHKLQLYGLRHGNKLTNAHVNFHYQKM